MTEQTNRNQQACRRRHWQAHVKTLKQSGLELAEYCRQHNLSYHALSYWHRKLSGPGSSKATLVPVTFSERNGTDARRQRCFMLTSEVQTYTGVYRIRPFFRKIPCKVKLPPAKPGA